MCQMGNEAGRHLPVEEIKMKSILTSVKKLLGIAEECTDFDADVVMYVNSALFVLSQIGVGPVGFTITGSEETWEQFSADKLKNEAVKAWSESIEP